MVDLTELYHIQVSINQGDAFQPAFSLICFVDMRDERAAGIDFNGNSKKTSFSVRQPAQLDQNIFSFENISHVLLICLQSPEIDLAL